MWDTTIWQSWISTSYCRMILYRDFFPFIYVDILSIDTREACARFAHLRNLRRKYQYFHTFVTVIAQYRGCTRQCGYSAHLWARTPCNLSTPQVRLSISSPTLTSFWWVSLHNLLSRRAIVKINYSLFKIDICDFLLHYVVLERTSLCLEIYIDRVVFTIFIVKNSLMQLCIS